MTAAPQPSPPPQPGAEPREVPLTPPPRLRPARPFGVWVVAAAGLAASLWAAWLVFQERPSPPVLFVALVLLALLLAYVFVAYWRGEGWARATVIAVSLGLMGLSLAVIAFEAGEGRLEEAWLVPTTLILVGGLLVAYSLSREARAFFSDVAWRETLADVKWAVSLLFLVMLGLFGMNNGAWAPRPQGTENIGGLVDVLLSADRSELGGQLPLVLLLQLLGVLLVAALIAAVVIAIRDPLPGEVGHDDHPDSEVR